MKLFGKDLFNFKQKETVLYDFARFGLMDNVPMGISDFVQEVPASGRKKKQAKVVTKPVGNPKELWKAGSLNDHDFRFDTSEEFIEKQIKNAEKKLKLLPKNKMVNDRFEGILSPRNSQGMDTAFGVQELESIVERLNNRRRISEFQDVLEKYPHTTTKLIMEIVEKHSNLRCARASGFMPDFPEEAVEAMTEYDQMCKELCGKEAVFYVLAKHEDFQKKNKRRDPILFAQSPFGFFWNILGAWDEEMIYLGEL